MKFSLRSPGFVSMLARAGGGAALDIVQSGLVANYQFNKSDCYPGTGTTVYDLCSSNTGALNDNVSFDAATGSMAFPGTSAHISCSATGVLGLSEYTLGAWVKFTGSSSTQGGVMVAGSAGYRTFQMVVRNAYSNVTGLEYYCSTVGELFATGSAVGGWHYWTITADGSKVVFYRDGKPIMVRAAGALGSSTGTLGIGHDFYGTYFIGNIKAVHVYDRVLSASEIETNAAVFGITQPSSISGVFTPPISSNLLMQIDINRSGTLWKDAARTQAAAPGDLIYGVTDLSGNANHWHDGSGIPLVYSNAGNNLSGIKVLRFTDSGIRYMPFTNSMSTIRTTYWAVLEELDFAGGYRFLLGHSSAYNFHSGSPHALFSSSSNVNLVRVNKVSGDIDTVRPTTLQVVTAQNSANANANEFARDRGNAYGQRSWVGDIALLLCYSSVHTTQEMSDTEDAIKAYLSI